MGVCTNLARWRRRALVVAFFAGWICSAQATWTIIGRLPAQANGRVRPISSGYFWDARRGLVGTGTGWISNAPNSPPPAIFYSNDGINWIESAHPIANRGAEITSITMRDSLVGDATLQTTNGDNYGLWTTSDGGRTWSADPGAPETATHLFYSRDGVRHLLQSTGGGAPNMLGASAARLGPNIVIVTRHNGQPNPPSATLVSFDGGMTFPRETQPEQSFGVYASEKYGTIFLAPEESQQNDDSAPMISNDTGRTWRRSGTWPQDQYGYWKPTGDIRGGRDGIYAQSSISTMGSAPYGTSRGLCRTTNNGLTWMNVGGPSNALDTRFVTVGCKGATVIAFDNQGNIWSSSDGGDGLFHDYGAQPYLSRDTVSLSATLCSEVRGGLRVWNDHCDVLRIDSIAFLDSSLVAKKALQFDVVPTTPRTLYTDIGDTIDIVWRPGSVFTADTAILTGVLVRYFNGTTKVEHDTIIQVVLRAESETMQYAKSTDTLNAGNVSLCSTIDTVLQLSNLGCDTLWIEDIVVDQPWQVLPTTTPIAIPKDFGNSSVSIPLRFQSRDVRQHIDSVRLALRFQGMRDTIAFGLKANVVHGQSTALWSGRAAVFGTHSICSPPDTAKFVVLNTGCDTMFLTAVQGLAEGAYQWVRQPRLGAIVPGAAESLAVRFATVIPGSHDDEIRVSIRNATGVVEKDTLALSGTMSGASRFTVEFSATHLQFSARSQCSAPDTLRIVMRNAGCDTIMPSGVGNFSDPVFAWLRPVPMQPILPGSVDTLAVVLTPVVSGLHSDSAVVGVVDMFGTRQDFVIIADALVGDSGRFVMQVPIDSLAFGSLPPCSQRDSVITIQSVGCDTLRVDSVSLAGTTFDVDRSVFPLLIPPGERRIVKIHFTPAGTQFCTGDMFVHANDGVPKHIAMTGIARGPVRLLLHPDARGTVVRPAESQWLSFNIDGALPEAPINRVEARIEFNGNMFHAMNGRAIQGHLVSFSAGMDTAAIAMEFFGMPDTSKPICAIEMLGLYTEFDTTPIRITRWDVGVAAQSPATCFLAVDTAGSLGIISACGAPESRSVRMESTTLRAFPSPADRWMTVETKAPGGGYVECADMLGRLLFHAPVIEAASLTSFSLVGWQAGMYVVALHVGDEVRRQTITVVR